MWLWTTAAMEIVINMDFKTLEKKILDVLNNLEGINVSNKLKAEAIRMEIETTLNKQVSPFIAYGRL